MARIVIRDEDERRAVSTATALAEQLQGLAGDEVTVRGPAPCTVARIASRHRQQIELLAASSGPLQRLLAAARRQGLMRVGADMVVDVDPLALL
jgi:primosomal protein N'